MVSFCLNMFSLERSGAVSYKMDPHQYPMVTFFNNDDDKQGFLAIEQFVTDVVDFSSQYGSDISITYTAYNLAGKPSKYPDYGDFPQAFVMRTYGNWWQEAPSRREIFMPQNLGKIVSQDYIDLRFEQAVFPVTISIYETFNPGSVVRIWAGLEGGKWELLWEGESKPYGHTARIFSPPLKLINEATNLIRLEFDHSTLEYYTQLDAVLLSGTNRRMHPSQRDRFTYGRGAVTGSDEEDEEEDGEKEAEEERGACGTPPQGACRTPPPSANGIDDKVFNLDLSQLTLSEWTTSSDSTKDLQVTPTTTPVTTNGGVGGGEERKVKGGGGEGKGGGGKGVETSLSEVCDALFKQLEDDPWWDKGASHEKVEALHPKENSGLFGLLPDETLLYIFGFLDLVSLSNCCTVNRHFHSIVMDSLLYTELNLKPYWPWMSPDSLTSLSKRCNHLAKLDLSWCFNYSSIPVNFFSDFIEQCGKNLIILRLDCCKFIDNSSVRTITTKCKYLKELTLRNCSKISTIGFEYIADLTTLERLDLYRTTIETAPLVKILKASPKLKHINLGGCVRVSSMDEVAQAMGQFNQELVTIDFWKTYSLTPVGVRALSQCSKLEEVDLGWCLGLSIPGDCMTSLAQGCPRMRKLFMAALRGITDRDLLPFVTRCPRLQQLDLLGLRCITADICLRFLSNCKELQLLDVSFCDQIQESDVLLWRVQFPEVAIKWSFQYDGGNDYYLPNHY